ncbi:MAG TPA: RnfABCDGE type electron transport complex subunit D [Trebonia sp.]|nr:RnfABCDGE type electron transport complex subunit D [Trebonia sp.]
MVTLPLRTRLIRTRRAARPASTAQDTASPAKDAGKPKDKRVAALTRFAISITAFNIIGRLWLGFETSWAALVLCLLTAYACELLLESVDAASHRRRPRYVGGVKQAVIFLLPAHIGATAISMLIYPSEDLWPFAFASAVAVCSKYLIQAPINGRMRHVLNPSNVGISAVLLIFSWVGVGLPYQFTETTDGILAWIIPLAVFSSGLMLNWKLTGKMPLVLGWAGGFALQAILRGLDPSISVRGALAPMTGLAFLLFTTYMITDPSTSPVRPRNQVIFGLACAGGYAAFMIAHIVYGIFYSVVIVCAIRGTYHWVIYWRARRQRASSSPEPEVTMPAGQPADASSARPEPVRAERE